MPYELAMVWRTGQNFNVANMNSLILLSFYLSCLAIITAYKTKEWLQMIMRTSQLVVRIGHVKMKGLTE